MDADSLEKAGLTNGEARAYLSLLELGESTAGPVVKKSGVSHSIIYTILENLEKKGLASHILKGSVKYFKAEGPGRLLENIESRQKKLQASYKEIEKLLPFLENMGNKAHEPEVRVLKGFDGVITAHERTYQKLAKGEEYFYLGIPAYQPDYFHAKWKNDHLRRMKAGIKCRLLFDSGTDLKILKNRNSYKGCDARYMPFESDSPTWIMGYKDTTAIVLVAPLPITIEIINQQIADSFKRYFENIWKMAKPFR